MTLENGGYVTRAELAAHLGPIRNNLKDIRDDVKSLVRAQAAADASDDTRRDFSAWKLTVASILVTLLSGTVSAIATLIWLQHG